MFDRISRQPKQGGQLLLCGFFSVQWEEGRVRQKLICKGGEGTPTVVTKKGVDPDTRNHTQVQGIVVFELFSGLKHRHGQSIVFVPHY